METHYWIKGRSDKKISLVAHIPNVHKLEKCPTIIYGHGFTGNKTGDNRMGVNLARFLCEKGFVVIRFDYVGSGESEGSFETDTNFTGWVEDFDTVLGWIKTFEHVDSTRIGLIGHSFSGAIVTYISTRHSIVKSVCALAPVYYLEERFKGTIIGEKLWESALNGKTMKNFYNKKYSLAPFFVEDLVTYNMPKIAVNINVPTLIIHGKKDQALPYEDSIDFLDDMRVSRKELTLFDDEEHLFSEAIHPNVYSWFRDTLIDTAD